MTPMFEQYHGLKKAHPDAILFFRMGDFYEVFFDDAKLCARVLDITLTSRSKSDDDPIPMAGVPHHAATAYVQRLVDEGYRVAIAEQVEDPATSKGLVRREVVRVATPGVVLDPGALESREPNHMAAVSWDEQGLGVAVLDPSTGDLRCTQVETLAQAIAELHRFEPREALLHPSLVDDPELLGALARHRALHSRLDDAQWAPRAALEALGSLVPDSATSDPALTAAGALVAYARQVSGGRLDNLHALHRYTTAGFMVLDDTTRRNLEITRTLIGGRRKGSLLGLLDRCATGMGSRALKNWLAFPLLDRGAIAARQRGIGALLSAGLERESLRTSLRQVADIERILARVAQGTAHARDLSALRRSLLAVPDLCAALSSLIDLQDRLPRDPCQDLGRELDRQLVDDPPISLTEGGLIRRGVHPELDEVTELSQHGLGAIDALEERERELTGISSLKIRSNKVFGYYIEVTRANLHRVPEDRYKRKQTLSNGERYITYELKELEEKVLGADERRKQLEYGLFQDLRAQVADHMPRLLALSRVLAELDVVAALAEVADRWGWCAPTVVDDPVLRLRAARHPVVEANLTQDPFVPNDCDLDTEDRRLIVLTGPNMSGKSTIMRQVAICTLLAQIGSFVPAEAATIGLCDRVFTRVGAADDLARGQSTFMVEMSETAAILHGATPRSLVILDEIGRGTSTYDGLAIAWAVAEDLASRIGCRALFATHYHELCELAQILPGVVNQSVAVSEWGDEIVFLRTLREGGASRSYGIQCARLAGLPDPTIERARALLTRFERNALRNDRQQLSLFGSHRPEPSPVRSEPAPQSADPVRELLQGLDPDTLTPRAALDLLYQLRTLAQGSP
ncbi:MAG: DNA mismatch repair protein MutS [Deltaproteobacteria bacterium]|nr:MAG: DNA mismatch repair protein MutS [Deltaproteobacteria bacterium]